MKPEDPLLQASRGGERAPGHYSACRWGQIHPTAMVALGWSQPQAPRNRVGLAGGEAQAWA